MSQVYLFSTTIFNHSLACSFLFLFYLHFLSSTVNENVLLIFSSSSSISPESGLGTSHSSLPGSGQDSSNDQRVHDDIYDPEILQPLGTCKALYPFDG